MLAVQYYIKHPDMVGLEGPFDTEDEAWGFLLKGPSTTADRNAMRELGWVVRTGMIPHKACGCGWCYLVDYA